MSWLYNGSDTKSFSDLDNLVHDVFLAPDFKPEDLSGFDATKATKQWDSFVENSSTSNTLKGIPEIPGGITHGHIPEVPKALEGLNSGQPCVIL